LNNLKFFLFNRLREGVSPPPHFVPEHLRYSSDRFRGDIRRHPSPEESQYRRDLRLAAESRWRAYGAEGEDTRRLYNRALSPPRAGMYRTVSPPLRRDDRNRMHHSPPGARYSNVHNPPLKTHEGKARHLQRAGDKGVKRSRSPVRQRPRSTDSHRSDSQSSTNKRDLNVEAKANQQASVRARDESNSKGSSVKGKNKDAKELDKRRIKKKETTRDDGNNTLSDVNYKNQSADTFKKEMKKGDRAHFEVEWKNSRKSPQSTASLSSRKEHTTKSTTATKRFVSMLLYIPRQFILVTMMSI